MGFIVGWIFRAAVSHSWNQWKLWAEKSGAVNYNSLHACRSSSWLAQEFGSIYITSSLVIQKVDLVEWSFFFFFLLGPFFLKKKPKQQTCSMQVWGLVPKKATSFHHRWADYCLMMQNRFSVSSVNSYGILQWQNGSNLPNVSSSTCMKLI